MSNDKVIRIGRRQFLVGAGGFTLAIPFLSSLEKGAEAQTAAAVQPRYFYVGTSHGGCWDTKFFPTVPLTQQMAVPGVSGHTVSAGALTVVPNGSTASVGNSMVLSANAASLSPGIVGKMNVLRGLDVPWYMAHNNSLTGDYAANLGVPEIGVLGSRPSIDQIMAASSSFYTPANLATTKMSTMILNVGALSVGLVTPGNINGGVMQINGGLSSLSLFQSMFGFNSGAGISRKSVIDLVYQNYKSLVQSNTRLSAADLTRLNQHLDRLSTLETQLSATVAANNYPLVPPLDNGSYGPYGSAQDFVKWAQLYMDVVTAGFATNASRIGMFAFGDTAGLSPSFLNSGLGDWHQYAAHSWQTDVGQGYLSESYQALFEKVLLYLANSLNNVTDTDGRTVLDNSLLVWGQECSMETHQQLGVQTVTFGSASGMLNTGLYCDYRDSSSQPISPYNDAGGANSNTSSAIANYVTHPGLLWSQYLATQLLAMGVPTSDWLLWKDSAGNVQQGYGTPYIEAGPSIYTKHYLQTTAPTPEQSPLDNVSPYFSNASQPLPFLMKS